MPQKPRVKAPKQRASSSHRDVGRKQRLLGFGVAAAGLLLGAVAVLAVVGLGGGDRPSSDEARAALRAAGCTLQVADAGAVPRQGTWHTIREPGGTAEGWVTNPPTAGHHYDIAAVFGIYEEPVEQARLVHNLEHGGVFIQYGDDVPEATVVRLREFYDRHQNGTIMAPLPRLGNQFALGAWVYEDDRDMGYLAKCRDYDEEAVSTFFEAFQFRGPERFDPSQLQPGM